MAESNQPAETPAHALARAYHRVFGVEGARSADQKLVWRDIESFCCAYRLTVQASKDGEYLENNLLVNEGRRSYWLRARGQILLGSEPQAKPLKVNRARRKP